MSDASTASSATTQPASHSTTVSGLRHGGTDGSTHIDTHLVLADREDLAAIRRMEHSALNAAESSTGQIIIDLLGEGGGISNEAVVALIVAARRIRAAGLRVRFTGSAAVRVYQTAETVGLDLLSADGPARR